MRHNPRTKRTAAGFRSTRLSATGAGIALALCLGTPLHALAQPGPSPSEHDSHHPGKGPAAGMGPPAAVREKAGGGMAGMGDGGGMEGMMDRMGVPPPRELYPEMMRLEDLASDREHELLERARSRRRQGSSRLTGALEDLDRARLESDRSALFEALGEARAGLDELESGLATEQALQAGEEPRKIALDWFRNEMNLAAPGQVERAALFGLGWFHAFVMALLTAFAVTMIGMYFYKMRRAADLISALSGSNDAERESVPSTSPTNETPSVAPPRDTPVAETGVTGNALLFEALRKTGSCGGCKNPCATRLRVAQIIDETSNVKTFRLAPMDGGPLPFEYLPGQFLNVIVPSAEDSGALTKRSYTIASSPTQSNYCEITVKRESEGEVSRHLHDTVKEGDELKIAAPYGRFTFTGEESDSIVLIGCGVGITPLMSAIRYLTDRSWPGEIVLFCGFRSPADFIFREELVYLERRHPNLKVYPTVSGDAESTWVGHTGRIDAAMVRNHLPDIQDRLVHICGPKPMMDATKDFLLELGVPRERIRFESFGLATPRPPAAPAEPAAGVDVPTVEFVQSKKSAALPSNFTILDAAETVDVEIEWSCRSGTCGSCTVKLLSGDVEMEVDDGLDEEDRAAGMVLACQARSKKNLVVEA